ncbi:MAG: hypothetical protein HY560_09240 [Gemmatimonadetes bacterium]|nr:hypothetical protein [Gemmatimonadota bacterium]
MPAVPAPRALLGALLAWSQSPSDATQAAERARDAALQARTREMYRYGYACAADSARLYAEAGGRNPADAAAAFARRLQRNPELQKPVLEGCRDALAGAPSRYGARDVRPAALPPPPPPSLAARFPGPFGEYNWVLWADLAVGLVLGLATATIRYGEAPQATRTLGLVALALLGLLSGLAAFVPLVFLGALLLFFNPPSAGGLFGMSLLLLAFLFGWALSAFGRLRLGARRSIG